VKILLKNTTTSGKLIIAVFASCACVSGRLEYNSLFARLGGLGWGAVSETFGCKSVDDNRDGLNV